ncbi:hypothetical protein NIM87_01790 [Devosia sp. XJ19-1]|uniref:Uncharacterized protein n=1 Tax=Devosia ureilytica TaxID=2952754 RepID=A0A9Q4ALM3_9HYPH|nr:hypothetical protein [Devosia ureilytica]MCP8882226.1 hypothetical protein [Devosia ureilytica]MCP8885887.1 hypothetical protein [Devosia ureilytica]
MSILLGVVLLFAALSVALAAGQAMAISRLAPQVEWRGWLFGWWRFGEISQRAGLSGEVQAAVYKRAVIAAVAFVILGLVLSGWVVNQRPNGAAETTSKKLTGWRIDAAVLNLNSSIRPVASMPGAILVES